MAPKKKKKDWGEDTRGTKAKQQKEMARVSYPCRVS